MLISLWSLFDISKHHNISFCLNTQIIVSGGFRYQVTTPGLFHYWSGYTDYYEILYYRGKLNVREKQPWISDISLKLVGQEALHSTSSGLSIYSGFVGVKVIFLNHNVTSVKICL